MFWTSFKPTETITAATVKLIVNKDTNTTRTTTILNELPSGLETVPTNTAGTRTITVKGYDNRITTV
jgi:hypothetical protein